MLIPLCSEGLSTIFLHQLVSLSTEDISGGMGLETQHPHKLQFLAMTGRDNKLPCQNRVCIYLYAAWMHYTLNWNKRQITWLAWSGGDGTLHTTPQPTTHTTCLDSFQNNSHVLWMWHINYCSIRKDICFESTSLYNTVSIFFFSLLKKALIWCIICSRDTQQQNHKNTFCRATSFHKAIRAPLCLILASNSEAIALDSKTATSGITPTSCLHSHVSHKRLEDIFPDRLLHEWYDTTQKWKTQRGTLLKTSLHIPS